MFFRKLNNSDLWNKIKILREYIKKLGAAFKQRACWSCGRSLNIYDFLSDNLEFSPEHVLKLWQNPILEFHCCKCFKELKINEIEKIEIQLEFRNCSNCNNSIDIYSFSRAHNYLKIKELNDLWLNEEKLIFCSRICERKYYRKKSN
ncbi:MAG: hypothetical protein EU539_00300 [Promethearchaeota archaeon]|nr:MAG: hypothetical protein EU539_00300 [Candidatus Lokiarchaeota archaeon]